MIALLGLLLAGLIGASTTAVSQSSQERHVLLISIDGLAAFHLVDQTLELPNIRKLIETGSWFESSETVFPSVTHPSHTTMTTGTLPKTHGVVNNQLTNRETGESFHVTNLSRDESIKVPTIFDAAKEAGMTTAAFFWPETLNDSSIDYNIAEVFNDQRLGDITATDPTFLQELNDAGIPIHLYFEWYGDEHRRGAGDLLLAEAAAHTFKKYRPRLTAVHLLATDVMQHNYGPKHYLARNALTVTDAAVGLLIDAVDEANLRDRTTFIVTADHGFATVEYNLNLVHLFEEEGLLDHLDFGGYGWTLFIELGESFNPATHQAALQRALDRALDVDGVYRVIGPDQFHELGYPRYEESPYVPGQYMIIGDVDTHLRIDPDTPSGEKVRKETPYHGHGYLPQHPLMFPALLFSGSGIRSGEWFGHTQQVNIAPTIAELLNVELPSAEGKVLEQILE